MHQQKLHSLALGIHLECTGVLMDEPAGVCGLSQKGHPFVTVSEVLSGGLPKEQAFWSLETKWSPRTAPRSSPISPSFIPLLNHALASCPLKVDSLK